MGNFLWFLSFVMVNDFYQFRVWFRHLVSLGCSCPALSQTRPQAPEYPKLPKMAHSARIMPQLYFLLLRPYYARNSAGRMCKGLAIRSAFSERTGSGDAFSKSIFATPFHPKTANRRTLYKAILIILLIHNIS